MQATYTERINLNSISDVICRDILELGAGCLSQEGLRQTRIWISEIENVLREVLDPQNTPTPKQKRAKTSKPQTTVIHALPILLEDLLFHVSGNIPDIESGVELKEGLTFTFDPVSKNLWLSRAIIVFQPKSFGLGRMYPSSRNYPTCLYTALVFLPRLIRKLAISTRTFDCAAKTFKYESAFVELDQSSAHLTILHGLLKRHGEKNPEDIMHLDMRLLKRLIKDKDQVRREVASCYSASARARKMLELERKFPKLVNAELLQVLCPDDSSDSRLEATPEDGKKLILSVLYGMQLENICKHHGLVCNSHHSPILVSVLRLLTFLPPILQKIATSTPVRFLEMEENTAGNVSVYLQSLETVISHSLMQFIGMERVCLYLYDGVFMSVQDYEKLFLETDVDQLIQDRTKLDCHFEVKYIEPELKGHGDLAIPNSSDIVESFMTIAVLLAQKSCQYDATTMVHLNDALLAHGLNYKSNGVAREILANYFGKFYMQSIKHDFLRVEYDPIIPYHIIDVKEFSRSSFSEMVITSTDINRLPGSKGEESWMLQLIKEVPRNCSFAFTDGSAKHNNLKRYAGLKRYLFDLSREPAVSRMNFGKCLTHGPTDFLELEPILRLMWTLCGEETETFVYQVKTFACRMQFTNAHIEVITQTSSLHHGIGKNLVYDKLLGDRLLGGMWMRCSTVNGPKSIESPGLAMTITDSSLIGSSFNGHEEGLLLLVADECTNVADKTKAANLKAKVTAQTLVVNQKFQPVRAARNKCMLVLLTNAPMAIRVEKNDRRHFVIRALDSATKLSPEQGSLYAGLINNDEWLFKFYKMLLAVKGVHPTTIQSQLVTTRHKNEICDMTLASTSEFLEHVLLIGGIMKHYSKGNSLKLSNGLVALLRSQINDKRLRNDFIEDIKQLGGIVGDKKQTSLAFLDGDYVMRSSLSYIEIGPAIDLLVNKMDGLQTIIGRRGTWEEAKQALLEIIS